MVVLEMAVPSPTTSQLDVVTRPAKCDLTSAAQCEGRAEPDFDTGGGKEGGPRGIRGPGLSSKSR